MHTIDIAITDSMSVTYPLMNDQFITDFASDGMRLTDIASMSLPPLAEVHQSALKQLHDDPTNKAIQAWCCDHETNSGLWFYVEFTRRSFRYLGAAQHITPTGDGKFVFVS